MKRDFWGIYGEIWGWNRYIITTILNAQNVQIKGGGVKKTALFSRDGFPKGVNHFYERRTQEQSGEMFVDSDDKISTILLRMMMKAAIFKWGRICRAEIILLGGNFLIEKIFWDYPFLACAQPDFDKNYS